MHWYQATVLGRFLLERLLNLWGLLNFRPARAAAGHRRCIAFQAYSIHLAQCFAPIIDNLKEEAPDVDVHFILLPHPHFSLRSLGELRAFVRDTLKIDEAHIHFFWQAIWRKYDVFVCTDVYARFPLRRTRKVLLKHGAGVASRVLQRHPLRKTIFDFDLVLVNGEADYELLAGCCAPEFVRDRVAVAGLPYLDRLRTCPEDRETYLRRIGLARDRRVALVAPSWRGLAAIQARDADYLDEIIAALCYLDWQVVIKLHACSFNKAMAHGEDWAARLIRYPRAGVRVDGNIDDVPAFLHSDLLITDISSRAFDFMLLDKPVITVFPEDLFEDALDRERIKLISEGILHARSPAELKSMIPRALNSAEKRPHGSRRLAERFFANHGRATEVVTAHLLREADAGSRRSVADSNLALDAKYGRQE